MAITSLKIRADKAEGFDLETSCPDPQLPIGGQSDYPELTSDLNTELPADFPNPDSDAVNHTLEDLRPWAVKWAWRIGGALLSWIIATVSAAGGLGAMFQAHKTYILIVAAGVVALGTIVAVLVAAVVGIILWINRNEIFKGSENWVRAAADPNLKTYNLAFKRKE